MQMTLRRGLFAIATALTLMASQPARAAGPALIPTNLAGSFTVAGPPDGFDLLHAPDADLVRYGFPPRPSRADHRATAIWESGMRGARHRVMPWLQQTNMAAGPLRPAHAGVLAPYAFTSQNWSAEVLVNQATTYGASSYGFAAGLFNVPVVNQAFGVCTGTWDHLFTWVGIDGWTNNEVFQAGTESDAYCDRNGSQQYYSAWFEWFPALAVRITNLAVSPGDAMVVWMISQSDTTGTALVFDETSGNYVVINFTAPAGTHLIGNSAEWVQERPYWNGVLSTLSNYVFAWMSETAAIQRGSNTLQSFGSPGPGAAGFAVTMLDDAGGAISFPQALGGNAILFSDEGSAK